MIVVGYYHFTFFSDCGPLYNPLNGVVNASVTTFNSEAVYECNTGYMLEGSGVRRCQNNGIWSGSEPTCVIIGKLFM